MIRAKSTINIQADPEQVFALITDVRQCGELNPRIQVINITAEPAGQVREGTVFHYRIVVEGRMTEYTGRVSAFETNHKLEIQTDTDPAVTIKYKIEPTPDGSCLEQELLSTMTPKESEPLELSGWFAKLLGKLLKESPGPQQGDGSLQQEEAEMEQQLQTQLDEWLTILKKYLEEQRSMFLA